MNELHKLITAVEGQLAELKAHAAKDVTAVEGDIASAETTVRAELQALLAKLKDL